MVVDHLLHSIVETHHISAGVALGPALSAMPTAQRACLSFWFVSYTVLIYDYFCTLEAEIDDVWSLQWSLGLTLFYLNRYLPVLDVLLFLRPVLAGPLPIMECRFLFPVTFWLVTVGLIISQLIMLLRTYAIWGRRRLILGLLTPVAATLLSSMIGVTAWKTYLDVRNMQAVSSSATDLLRRKQCALAALTLDRERRLALLGLSVLVFLGEALTVILTIIKANQHVTKISPLWVSQLYKNGIIYCICMLGISVANAIVILAAPYAFKPILLPVQRTLHSIFSNRVILLIFRHRKRNELGSNENHRRRPGTYAESTMIIFTSIYLDSTETGMEEEISWKTRAQMEWVQ